MMEPGMYDVKVYEGNDELETIRDLTETQALIICGVFLRHNIKHLLKKITERKQE